MSVVPSQTKVRASEYRAETVAVGTIELAWFDESFSIVVCCCEPAIVVNAKHAMTNVDAIPSFKVFICILLLMVGFASANVI